MARARKRWLQLELGALGTPNGRRKRGRRTVERVKREKLSARHPVHVTLRVRDDAPGLRRSHAWAVLRRCFRAGCERFGFRLIHFSVQTNHLHLICEADDARALSRGIQGLAIRIARRMNRLAKRRGKFFADRYHARQLRSPTEVRRALVYVLHNAAHHGRLVAGLLDVYSSAPHFNGWREPLQLELIDDGPPPVVPPTCWMLTAGWRDRAGGPLSITEVPA
jgi:putative transposase